MTLPSPARECPFCGFHGTEVCRVQRSSIWRVACTRCGAEGPSAWSESEAVAGWNRRTPNATESEAP